jgi:hypothetical protein
VALMLTRAPGESLIIARDVVVTFVAHRTGGEIRLAVTAPPDIQVDRLEVAFRDDPALRDYWREDGSRRYAGPNDYLSR